MNIRELNHQTICILGYGREGKAMAEALDRYAPECDVTIADKNPDIEVTNKKYWKQTGEEWLQDLDRFDVIIKSPGIPPQPEFKGLNTLTSSTQIFLDTVMPEGSLVVGITGTKGKSTTSSLIAAILTEAGKDVHLIGNIGMPAIAYIEHATAETIFVQELSSYQLMDLSVSPSIALITNFFPDHLDYHKTLEAYHDAKKHIARFQKPEDTIFYYAHSEGAKDIAEESSGTKVGYDQNDSPVAIIDTNLSGNHNLVNIAGAWKVAEHLGTDKQTAIEAIRSFKGLPHRLQSVGSYHGIEWVDDAISTTPESTIAAIDALGTSLETLIAGGQDRGYDFTKLAEKITESRIQNVILFPESGAQLKEALQKLNSTTSIHEVASMQEAVEIAKNCTEQGKICLMSPASPSYNMYKNFEEKGDLYQKEVKK